MMHKKMQHTPRVRRLRAAAVGYSMQALGTLWAPFSRAEVAKLIQDAYIAGANETSKWK